MGNTDDEEESAFPYPKLTCGNERRHRLMIVITSRQAKHTEQQLHHKITACKYKAIGLANGGQASTDDSSVDYNAAAPNIMKRRCRKPQ